MTEEKKSKNPFINMANEAKKKNSTFTNGKPDQKVHKAPKPLAKGFGGPNFIRKTGRGG